MTEITTISTILSSVKTATEIAKLIKNSKTSLEEAEIKLKMADLISALADIKIELSEVQVSQREKEQKIFELEKELNKKEKISFDGQLYWAENDKTAFCTTCFEKDSKYIHLGHRSKEDWGYESWLCKVCNSSYSV